MRDNKTFEYFIVRIVIIAAVLIGGFLGTKIISGIYYNKLFYDLSEPARAMDQRFQKQIEAETDSLKLCKYGINFYQTGKNDLALSAFTKATVVDGGLRDAWVWKGYIELKIEEENNALESLKKAEEIDPTYPLTYQLLSVAYQKTGNDDSSKQAQEKYEYLSK